MKLIDRSRARALVAECAEKGPYSEAQLKAEGGLDPDLTVDLFMEDRPKLTLSQRSVLPRLLSMYRKLDAIRSITEDKPGDLLDEFVDFVNGDRDACTVWHVTLRWGRIGGESMAVGKYRAAAVNDSVFTALRCKAPEGQSLGHWEERTRRWGKLFAVASREQIRRRDPDGSYNEWFDRLHLINADQMVLLALLVELRGDVRGVSGSFCFDTGPGDSASWGASGAPVVDLAAASPTEVDLVRATLEAIHDFPALRMMVAEEVASSTPVGRFLLLRAIADPVLDHSNNRRAVKRLQGASSTKTNAQARFLAEALSRSDGEALSDEDVELLGRLLGVRNTWAHRAARTPLAELWDTYAHVDFMRSVVHRVLLGLGRNQIAGGSDVLDFT